MELSYPVDTPFALRALARKTSLPRELYVPRLLHKPSLY